MPQNIYVDDLLDNLIEVQADILKLRRLAALFDVKTCDFICAIADRLDRQAREDDSNTLKNSRQH